MPLRNDAKTNPAIPADIVNTIFGNVETILPLNQDLKKRKKSVLCKNNHCFFSELQERIEKWSNTTTIGDVFKKFVRNLHSFAASIVHPFRFFAYFFCC